MKVLHICNSFMRSKVHVELYKRLDTFGVSQIIYTPERKVFDPNTNSFDANDTEIVYSRIIKRYHSYFFGMKTSAIMKDVEARIALNTIECVHATTLFSDGAVAYRIYKKYGIPYIVAVRNTDVNTFLKKAPHLWGVMRDILKSASKVVFISPSIEKMLLSHFTLRDLKDEIIRKSVVQPNGVNSYWINHICEMRTHEGHNLIYVGRFMANKNLQPLIEAVAQLKGEIPDINLNLVGGGGELEAETKQLAERHKDVVTFWGRIDDKDKLLEVYRKSDVFAMISKTETFGLVYIEALTQRCPVLFTKGQGIDGLFETNVGESVVPTDIEAVKDKLRKLLLHTNDYYQLTDEEFSAFDWDKIAQRYCEMYNAI